MADTRRYYGNIVGKYGPQVQAALNKLSGVEIRMVCPLHGPFGAPGWTGCWTNTGIGAPIHRRNAPWAVFYGSMYGDTENAVNILTSRLAEAGVKNIAVYDVSSTHVSTMIAEVFRCSHLVLAAPTYNNGVYPAMLNLLHDMKALNLQNRTFALVENGSWACKSGDLMQKFIDEEMKNMTVLNERLSMASSLHADKAVELDTLADAIMDSMRT